MFDKWKSNCCLGYHSEHLKALLPTGFWKGKSSQWQSNALFEIIIISRSITFICPRTCQWIASTPSPHVEHQHKYDMNQEYSVEWSYFESIRINWKNCIIWNWKWVQYYWWKVSNFKHWRSTDAHGQPMKTINISWKVSYLNLIRSKSQIFFPDCYK